LLIERLHVRRCRDFRKFGARILERTFNTTLASLCVRAGRSFAHSSAGRLDDFGRSHSAVGRSRNPRRYWILDDLDDLDGKFPLLPYVTANLQPAPNLPRMLAHRVIHQWILPPPLSHIFQTRLSGVVVMR
jgi:hypothetical protein